MFVLENTLPLSLRPKVHFGQSSSILVVNCFVPHLRDKNEEVASQLQNRHVRLVSKVKLDPVFLDNILQGYGQLELHVSLILYGIVP